MRTLPRRLAAAASIAVLSVTSFAACSGDGDTASQNAEADTDDDGEASPDEVMEFAKNLVDETSGVRLSLSTADSPDLDNFLINAEGVVTRQPAFEGTAAAVFQGQDIADLGVVSVDDTFYVDLPFLGWTEQDPGQLCAPDPGQLLDPETGLSPILTSSEDLEEGESERGGPDNSETLTVYSGTVPGAPVKNVLPCAPGDEYDVKFTVNGDGYLRGAEMTGQFFSNDDVEITYTIDVDEYDVEQEITAPAN